ncbi:DUF6454 family protein [Microvirga terrae]|uniref:DUF6454 family protein n=1 Tax=Microvirga terrae TaxID=2740529 RepID=A0ABY5RMC2_9HYPH|nr:MULTISPECIES: DUF6454 family protein [Microvirga]MBQ0820510.1 hypothetical protein [Microvirga sp. HBU67558]UVF18044.1 DUF6454 family protein [Microvirga terrae]
MECFSRRGLATMLTMLCLGAMPAALMAAEPDRNVLAERVTKLSRGTQWKPVSAVPINFLTHHPQGMVKIGDTLFVSSVEIKEPTKRFPQPVDGYDRDTGAGVGHLFKLDMKGNLIADLTLGEGTIYHPGGIDYDGKYIWVPVAEYRPNSRSIVYRVDPETMKAEEMFRFSDHVGGVVHNTDDKTLHGVSWGSRRFYRWSLDESGKPTNASEAPEKLRTLNTSHYLDYQDCKYAGKSRMLCSGVTEMRVTPDAPLFRLGGLDLVSLSDGRPIAQTPVLLWTAGGMDMTHNPVWMEASDSGIRGYFMPEDDKSTLYIYETEVK